MDLNFGPWRPDQSAPGSGFAQVAEGVLPVPMNGTVAYAPFPQQVSPTGAGALNADPQGLLSVRNPDGTYRVVAATSTTIQYLQSDYTWADIETGRSSVTQDVSMWVFGKYLLNTDATNGLKAYDLSLGGTNTAVSGAPAGRSGFSMANVNFLLGTTSNPRRYQSSNLGSHTAWSGGTADGNSLTDGGDLICGADLANGIGVMFQSDMVRSIQFGVGAGAYAVRKVAEGIGCIAERTRVAINGAVFWWSEDGPWMMTGGTQPEPIGYGKIEDWAAESIGRNNYATLQAAVDPQRKTVFWRIDASRVLTYDWYLKEWSVIPATTVALARIATPAVTIDTLSGTIDEMTGTIDDLSGGSAPILGGLNNARKYFTFTGANMAATIETCPIKSPVTGLYRSVTPVDDANSGTVQIGVTDRTDGTLTWKAGASKQASGRAPIRGRGKMVAFRRNIEAGATWSYALGVQDIEGTPGGAR